MTKIILAHTKKEFETIAELAERIWVEHYTPIIGAQQVTYMLNKFQSVPTMEQQVKNGAAYYLLEYEGTTVGYFSYTRQEDYLFLSKLYVLRSIRGNGIGKAALVFLEAQTKKLGVSKVQLTVNKYNTNSIKAYEKMGFNNVKAIVQDIGNGYVMDDFVLEKKV